MKKLKSRLLLLYLPASIALITLFFLHHRIKTTSDQITSNIRKPLKVPEKPLQGYKKTNKKKHKKHKKQKKITHHPKYPHTLPENQNNTINEKIVLSYFKKEQEKKEKSQKIKEQILKELFLLAELPPNFIYSEVEVDSDEPIKILRGENKFLDARFILAGTTIITDNHKRILEYAKKNIYLMPDADLHLMPRMKKTLELKDPKPGFKKLILWEGYSRIRNKLNALVYLPRSDNKGAYIIAYSGNLRLIEKNEGYYEELLNKFHPITESNETNESPFLW